MHKGSGGGAGNVEAGLFDGAISGIGHAETMARGMGGGGTMEGALERPTWSEPRL